MKVKVMTYQVNIVKRDMPVSDWLVQQVPIHKKIGGLLDYGYSKQQIREMIGIPRHDLNSLMHHYSYKTIDKSKIAYKELS